MSDRDLAYNCLACETNLRKFPNISQTLKSSYTGYLMWEKEVLWWDLKLQSRYELALVKRTPSDYNFHLFGVQTRPVQTWSSPATLYPAFNFNCKTFVDVVEALKKNTGPRLLVWMLFWYSSSNCYSRSFVRTIQPTGNVPKFCRFQKLLKRLNCKVYRPICILPAVSKVFECLISRIKYVDI